jgi:hypothetical protein
MFSCAARSTFFFGGIFAVVGVGGCDAERLKFQSSVD